VRVVGVVAFELNANCLVGCFDIPVKLIYLKGTRAINDVAGIGFDPIEAARWLQLRVECG
jgi:hypothetical protein